MEKFIDINGYEGIYQVSNFGNIKSLLNNNKILIATKHKCNGYHYIQLVKNRTKKSFRLHNLVISNFIGESDSVVNHIDGNKSNNKLENLEYVSRRENICHYWKNLKYPGVSFVAKLDKFRARIFFNNKSIHLGYFITQVEAYNKIKQFEFENFIENKYR